MALPWTLPELSRWLYCSAHFPHSEALTPILYHFPNLSQGSSSEQHLNIQSTPRLLSDFPTPALLGLLRNSCMNRTDSGSVTYPTSDKPKVVLSNQDPRICSVMAGSLGAFIDYEFYCKITLKKKTSQGQQIWLLKPLQIPAPHLHLLNVIMK